jgi:hypothetical protein
MERIKYSRSHHLPWSPGATSDDKMVDNVDHFVGEEVVVTEKMDGENCTIYPDGYTHARSVDSKDHASRKWVRRLGQRMSHQGMPLTYRVCGENLYARHSIGYERLPSYFLVFGIYEGTTCLSWDETVEWCELLDLPTVPVLYRGPWDEALVRKLWEGQSAFGEKGEGYVVRVTRRFDMADFATSLNKWVRPSHVQTEDHWMFQEVVPNGLVTTGE